MTQTTTTEVEDYLARVRAALADLPADEVAEIMEDVTPHVAEVALESGDLTARLGTPEEYAAELRAAGGYPEAVPPVRSNGLLARLVLWIVAVASLVAFVTGTVSVFGGQFAILLLVGIVLFGAVLAVFNGSVRRADIEGLQEYAAAARLGRKVVDALPARTVDYLRSLRPAWSLIRIGILVIGALAIFSVGRAMAGLLGLLVVGGLFLWSGSLVRTDRRHLLILVPANAFVIGLGLALAGSAISQLGHRDYLPVSYDTYGHGGLTYNGGSLSNVYAADSSGKAIPEFYLYDEDGRPLNVPQKSCDGPSELSNRFPLPVIDYRNGYCVLSTGRPFVPLPPNVVSDKPTVIAPPAQPTGQVLPSVSAPPPVSSAPSAPASSVVPTK